MTRYLGIVALATDHGTDTDIHEHLPAGYRVVVSRTGPYAVHSTDSSLSDIEETSRRLLPGSPLVGIGYGCTSGGLSVGDSAIIDAITRARPASPAYTLWPRSSLASQRCTPAPLRS